MSAPSLSAFSIAAINPPEGVQIRAYSSRDEWLSLRNRDVTASVVAGLLGIHPYTSALQLHLVKTGRAEDASDQQPVIDGNRVVFPPMVRGLDFEPVAVKHVELLRPNWRVSYPINRYWTNIGKRIGCTPDALVVDPTRAGFGVLQVKTTSDFILKKTWADPDTGEIVVPMWIAVQAMTEAKLTGASWAAVAVLSMGLETSTELFEIPLNGKLWARIEEEVGLFWDRIGRGELPPADYGKDGAILMRLYAHADPDSIADLSGETAARMAGLADRRAILKEREADGSAAEKERKVVDAEVIDILRNAEAGRLPDGRIVQAKVTKRGGYTVAPTSYRSIKVIRGVVPAAAAVSTMEKF